MAKTAYTNARIIPMTGINNVIWNGFVLIEDGRFQTVAPMDRFKPDNKTTEVNLHGALLIPGLIQSHIHICQTLYRNQAEDLPLIDWLQQHIWPFEASLDEETIHASAMLGLYESLQSGTTAILDMGSVHHTGVLFEAAKKAGIRAVMGKAMMDACPEAPSKLQEKTDLSIQTSSDLCEKWHGANDELLHYAYAPRFALSCSDELIKITATLARKQKARFHTHASENAKECQLVQERTGTTNIRYLHRLQALSENSCLAHCIHLETEEIALLRQTGSHVLHCPGCNMKLGSGIAPIREMLERGISVGVGADGAPCNNLLNPFLEMKRAALLQKLRYGPAALSAYEILKMATVHGAHALGIDHQVGQIADGMEADFLVIRPDIQSAPFVERPNTPANDDDTLKSLYAQVIYATDWPQVQSVFIRGKEIVRGGVVKTLDREVILKEGQKAFKKTRA